MADPDFQTALIDVIHRLEAAGDKLAPQAMDAAMAGFRLHGIITLSIIAVWLVGAVTVTYWLAKTLGTLPEEPSDGHIPLMVGLFLFIVISLSLLIALTSSSLWMEAINPAAAIAYRLIAKV